MSAHVLVVDDDWMNREVMEANLLVEKFQVNTANNGKKAIEAAQTHHPDIILLDAMLPDMSGFDVCAHLKSEESTRHIPIVIVTALESDNDKRKAISAGADDFVSKPINYLLLTVRIKSLVRMRQVQMQYDKLRVLLQKYVDTSTVNKIFAELDSQD